MKPPSHIYLIYIKPPSHIYQIYIKCLSHIYLIYIMDSEIIELEVKKFGTGVHLILPKDKFKQGDRVIVTTKEGLTALISDALLNNLDYDTLAKKLKEHLSY